MKKIKIFAIIGLIATISFLNSCGNKSKEHTEEAKKNIKEANKELKEATKDASEEIKTKATTDWQKFKLESEIEIAKLKKQSNDLKVKIEKNQI